MKINNFQLLLFVPLLCSCTPKKYNDTQFLNYKYVLSYVGDIHGADPRRYESLGRVPGITSYSKKFDQKNSFINFQCRGDSFENYHCETTFSLKDIEGNVVIECLTPFNSTYKGGEEGNIIFDEPTVKEKIDTIYVYTPYWVRIQLNYDINKDGNNVLLTFEFWKKTFNDIDIWSE